MKVFGYPTQGLAIREETAFQNCAEPWMAEPKRHMDVPKERVLESSLLLDCSSQSKGKSRDSASPGKEQIRPSRPACDHPSPYGAHGRTSCSSTSKPQAYQP